MCGFFIYQNSSLILLPNLLFMNKIRTKLFAVAVLFFTAYQLKANALYPVSIDEKIANSTNIIEGKVVSKTSFWNAAHTVIFTANKVKVYKIFKGGLTDTYIDVLTQGGTVGVESMEASDLLTLETNDIGVFFLFPNVLNLKSPVSNNTLMDVYSSSQGCFIYDIANKKAYAPFVSYGSITGTLYTELQIKTGNSVIVKDPSFNLSASPIGAGVLATPSITTFSPTTVRAGASLDPSNNILTIEGTNFGTAGGSAAILFSDGNTGGSSPTYVVNSTDGAIVQWTNTQIKVRVPTRAATGFFSVRESSGLTAQSADFLNVYYSILQVSGTYKQMNLIDQNGTGGYTVYFSNSTDGGGLDLDGSATKATVQRALATWREIVGMNWPEGGATTSQSLGNNTENIVMYDNTNSGTTPLAAGVLAVCYSYSIACSGKEGQKTAFDVIIRNAGVSTGSASFTTGPCSPSTSQIDLETVLLHELGHAISLGHINDGSQGGSPNNNPGKLMHYAVEFGVKRSTPDGSAYRGALYLCNPQNLSFGSCTAYSTGLVQTSYTTVTNDDCPASFSSLPTNIGTVVPFDLVHATSNSLSDPQYTELKCTGTGTGVTNTQYYAVKTANSGVLSISVTGYSTTPGGLNSCSSKGIELALYQVSSCPDGQNYPTPVACRTFTTNTTLTDITGLLANTDYLLVADGVANTKATFNLTFNGSALPIKLTSFTGEIFNNYNLLKWTADVTIGTSKINVEKSADGTTFESIGSVNGTDILKSSNSFKDNNPFVGNNFYRLAVVSNTGEKEYSNIVVLKRKDKVLLSMNPNPAKGSVNVQISSEVSGKYYIELISIAGVRVISNNFIVSGNTNQKLNVSNISNGVYQVVIYDANHNRVSSQSIIVEN